MVATCHHSFGYGKEFLDRDIYKTAICATLLEAGNKYTWEPGPIDIDSHPNHCGCIEHHIHSEFGVVADDWATELKVGAHERVLAIVPEANLRIVVFQIGAIHPGADITPLPYHSIAEIAIVSFVGIAENHGIVNLSTDFHIWAESASSVKF